ncbi:S1 RNA-binding domain-containing protein [Candidatus Woesearchaeota archaeon]|nr:S1 RNA-binding domain-containing protein [Candidatus Woesearchaeota archaeon]
MLLLKKKGFPEDSELVLCTVTSIQSHSVFVRIEEYDLTGMIHISEVSPGRIRNIRDFVREDKVVVCKVLRVNQERGHVDLSLRRVTDAQKRSKINEIKHEQKAEKIVEVAAKKLNIDNKKMFDDVASAVLREYGSIFSCFSEVAEGRLSLVKLGLDRRVAEELESAIRLRIKPAEVSITGSLLLTSYAPNGVAVVKDALRKVAGSGAEVSYIRAGKYKVTVRAANYKVAEQIIERATMDAINYVAGKEGSGDFERAE